jgi:hypothetical protein
MTVKLTFQLRYAAAFDHGFAFRDPADHKAYQKQKQEKQNNAQRGVREAEKLLAQKLGFTQYCTISNCRKSSKSADNKAFSHKKNIISLPRHDGSLRDKELCKNMRIMCSISVKIPQCYKKFNSL